MNICYIYINIYFSRYTDPLLYSCLSLWGLSHWPCWVRPPAHRRPGPAGQSYPPSLSLWLRTFLRSPEQTSGRSWCDVGWALCSARLCWGNPESSLHSWKNQKCEEERHVSENNMIKRGWSGCIRYSRTYSLYNTLLIHDIGFEPQYSKHH